MYTLHAETNLGFFSDCDQLPELWIQAAAAGY